MAKLTVTVTDSPHETDYIGDGHPPWSYSGTSFKNWVWEVLLDMGKAGKYPRNVVSAIEIAEASGYTVVHEVQS